MNANTALQTGAFDIAIYIITGILAIIVFVLWAFIWKMITDRDAKIRDLETSVLAHKEKTQEAFDKIREERAVAVKELYIEISKVTELNNSGIAALSEEFRSMKDAIIQEIRTLERQILQSTNPKPNRT